MKAHILKLWKQSLLTIRYGWDRLFHPKSRADELWSLRQRYWDEASTRQLSKEATDLAISMRDLRKRIVESYGEVYACSSCAKGCVLPHGQWEGGFCCSGNTEDIFSSLEIAALKASGTRLSHLQPPDAVHAGCAFRGPMGCSLQPEHRPNLCVHYVCHDLARELAHNKQFEAIEGLGAELTEQMLAFKQLRSKRLEEEEWKAALQELADLDNTKP
ncbi:MAG: hypothetical protein EP343_10835 [Deltaproteobacteria bacterium]|nr:MAG: hypothetical protein EP343_10835 [Deltaproteobacteria bacterium]